ncbi:putative copper export protein [uncultured Mycobacterium sp.]|uniref:Putative copper export protein n=1 Tax=uncultured Mycobacterium sp. TaxID=171292 RepID=A0A1Y5PLZ4_9MYCO|nr:putative copper export protein [uncultured Mycobacterium sp.]
MPGTAPPNPAALVVVTQVIYYLSLAIPLGIGMTVGALAIPERHGGLVSRQARSLAVPAAVIVVAGAALQFHATTHVTDWALIELAVLGLAACGLLALRWTPSRLLARAVGTVAILAAVIPRVPLAWSTLSRMATNVVVTVHLLSAMTWVGGLTVLAATAIAGRRTATRTQNDDRLAADWAQIWQRFSMVALVVVGALAVSGTWLAWTHVGTPSQFFTTTYGRFLAVKLVLVLALLGGGAYNVRILLPKIHVLQRDGDTRGVFLIAAQHFPSVVAGEALVSIGILTVVPFLRGSARNQAGWPSAPPFDLGTLGTGLLLIAVVAAIMWAGTRRSFRPLQPSRPVP